MNVTKLASALVLASTFAAVGCVESEPATSVSDHDVFVLPADKQAASGIVRVEGDRTLDTFTAFAADDVVAFQWAAPPAGASFRFKDYLTCLWWFYAVHDNTLEDANWLCEGLPI